MISPIQILHKYIVAHWGALQQHHLEIVRGALWLILFVGLSKLAGLIKEMIVAAELGVSSEMDAFMLALTLSTMLVGPVVHALQNCLATSYAEWQERKGAEEDLRQFQGTLNTFTLLGGISLLGLQHGLLPYLPFLLGIELEGAAQQRLLEFGTVLNLYIPLSLWMAVVSTRLLMRKQQINTLLESLPAVATMIACLIWPEPVDGWTLITGFLLGSAVQWVIMEALQVRFGHPYLLRWHISPELLALGRRMRWMLPAQVLTASTTVVDHTMAAWLGPGSLSTLGYATRVLAILLTLSQTVLSRATLPVFGELRQTPHLLATTVRQWHRIAFWSGTAAALLTGLIAQSLIEILFERGAFTTQDTFAVRNVLWAYLLQIPFYLASTILFITLTLKGKQQAMFYSASLISASNIILNLVLMPILGLIGIALSTSLCYMLSWILYRNLVSFDA